MKTPENKHTADILTKVKLQRHLVNTGRPFQSLLGELPLQFSSEVQASQFSPVPLSDLATFLSSFKPFRLLWDDLCSIWEPRTSWPQISSYNKLRKLNRSLARRRPLSPTWLLHHFSCFPFIYFLVWPYFPTLDWPLWSLLCFSN